MHTEAVQILFIVDYVPIFCVILLSDSVMELPHVTLINSFWVFVGLSFYTTEEELKNVFSLFGAVEEGTLFMLF